MGNDEEEMMTALYMKKVITEAGIESKLCTLPNGLCWKDSNIVDQDGQIVKIVWKLWNWKRIFQDYLYPYRDNEEEQNGWRYQHPCLSDILLNDQIRIIEPIWKSITSYSAFLPVLYMMFPDHPNILQEQWILPEDSQPVPFLNWSMDEQTYENSIMGHFRIDESMKGYFNYDYLPREFFSRKNSDETIVSWIINGLFSGFSIRDDQNQIIDTKNSLKCCCVI
jgi:glutathionylspermidine synthase